MFGAAAGQQLSLAVGVTHGAYSADPYENPQAVASAKSILAAEPIYQNQAIMGFGTGNPEPAPGVYDWSGMDRRMSTIRSTGGVPVITLVGAPDWMKGGAAGTTNFDDVPFAPSPQHYADFAALAVQVARRYPWVKTFVVWNELKGFWDSVHNRWDYVHYTEMYNAVYDALKAYNPALQIGGPYVTIESDTYTSTPPPGSLYGPWGVVDPRSLQVLTYWLAHKHGADFISLDARATTTSGGQQADEFTSDEKFAAVDAWVRQRTALPIWWSEFYDQPPGTSWTPQHQDAALSTAMAEMALSGASVALIWSPEADATDPTERGYLWTYADVAGGGQPSPLAASFEAFNKAFSPVIDGGTPANNVTLVINPTDGPLDYEGTTLAPYQVLYLTQSAAAETGPPPAQGGTGASTVFGGPPGTTKITTVAGGSGQGIAMHVAQSPDSVAIGPGMAYVADPVTNVVRGVGLQQAVPTRRTEDIVAGTGTPGSGGDGGSATSASLNHPEGLAVDSAGDLFIADTGNNRIRKVSPNGTITTVAGNGVFGYSGDGGPAVAAHLANPTGVAIDSADNLYIVDDDNNVIRRVAPDGTITTVAGTGVAGYSGDGGPATSATLNGPTGVAVDADGDLYISDGGNNAIREVTPDGTIETIAGTGTLGFSGDGGPATAAQLAAPAGVAVTTGGDIVIADAGNERIRQVSPSGTITTIAGNGTRGFSGDSGPATAAELANPEGVATDASGNVWIVDGDNRRIREVTSGVISSPIGGGLLLSSGDGGSALLAEMDDPTAVAVDAQGDLYVADSLNNRVRKIAPDGTITTVAGNGSYGFSGDGGAATQAMLWDPVGLAVDAAGNLYIADFYNNRVRKVTPAGIISTVVGYGTYGFAGDGGGATKAWLEGPTAVAVDAKGDLFVADSGNDRIREVTPAWGQITTIAGTGVFGSSGDGGPATAAELDGVAGLAVDAAGNVWAADQYDNRIRRISAAGVITTVAGNGIAGFAGDGGPATAAELSFPAGVAVDPAGDVYIADEGNDRIQELTAAGTLETVAGSGAVGFAGDGGPAVWGRLSGPQSVAVGPDGSVYIADTGNNRVRKVK